MHLPDRPVPPGSGCARLRHLWISRRCGANTGNVKEVGRLRNPQPPLSFRFLRNWRTDGSTGRAHGLLVTFPR